VSVEICEKELLTLDILIFIHASLAFWVFKESVHHRASSTLRFSLAVQPRILLVRSTVVERLEIETYLDCLAFRLGVNFFDFFTFLTN
jgi:hypothetical protein